MIYLDNAATTKVDDKIVEKMKEILTNTYANPSSIHGLGRQSKILIDNACESIANKLGCIDSEIFFTSGASESNNWAIISAFEMMKDRGNHIIASSIEHESVLRSLEYLQNERGAKITLVNPHKDGRIYPDDIKKYITKETILICLMYVNNETGIIQPIKEVIDIAHKNNILFHCDAVQALGKMDININKIGADTMSFSAHKIHGIKGSGILYIREGLKIKSFIHGGSQQNGRRAGTQNPEAPILFDMALELIKNEEDISLIKKHFLKRIKEIENIKINGDEKFCVDNILNISIDETDSEDVLIALDMNGICASAGSACSAGSIEASYVLKAMGLDYTDVRSAIRFSFSKYNTIEEIDIVVDKLKEIVANLRGFAINI